MNEKTAGVKSSGGFYAAQSTVSTTLPALLLL